MKKHDGINRGTLYEEVWQLPMIEVGKRYGVSRPTIKWACQELGVPLPPQAYWIHRKRGHLLARPDLPRRQPDQPQVISRATLLQHERPSRRSVEQRRRARKLRLENAQCIMEERIFHAELMAEVDDWHRAQSIRHYLAELDRRLADGGRSLEGYAEWRAKAERYLSDLCPADLRVERYETAFG